MYNLKPKKKNEIVQNCVESSLMNTYFLHFAGSWYDSDHWKIKNIFLNLKNKYFVIYSTIIFTIISWIGGLGIVYYLVQNLSLYESILKVIFIGLAALTLPHMLLVDIVYRRRFK